MADVTSIAITTALSNAAIAAIMAAVLWSLPHRAAKFAAAAQTLVLVGIAIGPWLPDPRYQNFAPELGGLSPILLEVWRHMGWMLQDLPIVLSLVVVALYPEPARRWWELTPLGAYAAFHVWRVFVNLGLLDGLFLSVPAGVDVRTTAQWYWLSAYSDLSTLLGALVLALWLRRALRHAGPEKRAAAVWAATASLGATFGIVGTLWTYYLRGFETHQFWPIHCALTQACVIHNDPFWTTFVLKAGAILAGPAYVVYAAWRRQFIPLALVGIAMGSYVLDQWASNRLSFASLATGFLFLWVVTQYNLFGAKPFRRGVSLAIAGGFGVAVFFNAFATTLSFSEQPIMIGVATMVGLLMGGAAAYLVLRQVLGMRERPGEDATTTRTRIEPYHALLAQELAAGTSADDAFAKLKPARASLRVSDHEHSLLAFASNKRSPGESAATLQPGRRFLDRYVIQQSLRSGGSGVAHLAKDEKLNRLVVIKTLRAQMAGAQGLDSLLHEAKAQGTVAHANVVTLHDADRVGDEVFLVMEYVEGGSLADRLRGKPLGAGPLRVLVRDVTSALAAVHGANLVHRDVKPSNIFMTKDGKAKLGDFGIAHMRGFEATIAAGPATAIGTLRYMSPEQARGRPPRVPSDLWGAAVTLYEAATGRPYVLARPKETGFDLQVRVAGLGPFTSQGAWTPAQRAFWHRALNPEPAKRFRTAAALGNAFAAAWP